ncbi:MAG TPA: hypothetical protein VLW75_08180 [Rhizomicrobium sp.]|nr:hypothetical protein [Rhizomicrobium sp.]
MRDLLSMAGLVLAGLIIYAYFPRIQAALRRFDEKNIARRHQEALDRKDRHAHFKHTLMLAEEQVEEVSEFAASDERTGEKVTRYLFEGETFLTRDDAEDARNEAVLAKAREFYVELPKALAERRKEKLN